MPRQETGGIKSTGGLQPVMSVLLSNRAQQALVLRLSSTSERHASFLVLTSVILRGAVADGLPSEVAYISNIVSINYCQLATDNSDK